MQLVSMARNAVLVPISQGTEVTFVIKNVFVAKGIKHFTQYHTEKLNTTHFSMSKNLLEVNVIC